MSFVWVWVKVTQSHPNLYNPVDCSPPRFLCPWISSGKNTGVGCHCPGILDSKDWKHSFKGLPLNFHCLHQYRRCSSIPGSGRSLGDENDNLLQYSCLENSMEEPGRLQSMRLQRVRNDWATNTFTLLFYLLWLIRWILLSYYCLCMRIFMIELLLQWLSGK